MEQRIILTQQLSHDMALAISECEHDHIFILTDTCTHEACLPVITPFLCLKHAVPITIPATDSHKDLSSLTHVWECLQQGKATRHSLLINLGGGMVTDLGGFAASTFKRGINFINIPTTLLAMVDASVGGKTGINFGGLKNEIGVFNEARFVLLYTQFLQTLDSYNLRSGYAEMLKHGLLANEASWSELLHFDLAKPDFAQLGQLLAASIQVKEHVVAVDPLEHGLRKALNLGHTFGHAIESLALTRQPLLHGFAVAYGLIAELYLSSCKAGFSTTKLHQTVSYIKEFYGTPAIDCNDYPELLRLMHHDKKSTTDAINVTLLNDIGDVRIDCQLTDEEAQEALDFLREC